MRTVTVYTYHDKLRVLIERPHTPDEPIISYTPTRASIRRLNRCLQDHTPRPVINQSGVSVFYEFEKINRGAV